MIGASVMPKHLRWNTILVVALAVLLVTGSHLLAQRQQGQGQRGQRPNTSEAPPSEVPPEAAPDAKPASPEVKPDESYTMLVTPAIAARMGLTDQQIAQVASLMVERSQKLSSTEEDQWNAIRAENEEKLKAVLTEEQQANWLKVIHEKTLIIIFDKAAWAEVLTWFADRLGLQLIMETPPPGTFTFSDRTEYSPAEALDMLNSVLQARGYTLVRYENLLHLFNLTRTKQIPAVYLPKLQPADLDNRKAKFEFVAVTYALSRRNREAVDAQIKQYLGPNSYVIDLPGNSFMLIDTVASHRLINKVIYAMADPAAPEQQQRPPQAPGELPPLPTDWDTYTILKNDPAKVEEIVREYGGISSMVRLPNSPQIHVLANDDQHRNVRSIIDRLDVDPGTTMMPTVQIYSLDQLADAPPERLYMMYRMWGSLANLYDVNETFVKKFLEMLEKIVPNAVTTYESNNRKLVVLAVPDDQAKISELIEKLKRTFTDEDAPVIKVYKLKGSVSLIENVVENVQKLVPKAMVEFNRGDRYLLVVGSADEHKMITAAIEEVESVSDDGIERKMVCYPVNRMLSNRWNMLWRDLRRMPEFEGVLELSEGRDNQLTIWATAEQHVRMRQVLDELTGGGEAIGGANDADEGEGTTTGTSDRGRANELIAKAFVVRRGNVNSLQWVLPQVIPGISVYPEPESSTILVYGTRKALDSVEDFIFKVDEEFGFGVLVLPLDTRPTDDFMTTMRMTFRRFGNVTFDPKNMRLIAYGPKSELAQIEKIMAELKRTTPEEPKTMMTLPVKQDLPDHLVEFVRDAVPRAEIQYDKESKLVSVAGTKTEQLLASKVILEVEASLPPPERVRLFPVGRLITDDFINTVKTNVDYIREVKRDDLDPMSLYVKARPAVLDEVERLLDDLQDQFKLKPSSLLVVYSVTQAERSRFDSVQSELKKEIGEFRILNDDRRNVMPVWALPLQHERIGEMLESLKTVAPLVMPEKFITYSPRFTENATLQQLVKDIYPDVNITEDSANNRLILRVPTQIAESVDSLLKQIDTADPNRVKRYFASYPVGRVNILDPLSGSYFSWYDMLQQLQPLAPNAKLTYDTISQSIFVWGTAEEHEIIKETIENIHNTEPADRFGRFPIHRADPSEVIYFVQGMLPNLQFMYDPTGKTLIVQSRNAEQRKLVAALIEKLDPEDPGPNDPQIRFYQLSDMPSDQVINTLQWLTHEAYIVPDAVNRQLMVVARPAEHELIRKNVDLIVSTFTPDEPVLFLYTVTDDQRKRIESFVQTATEEMAGLSIRIVDDTSPGQMSIYARPLGHQLIADALVMMSANTAAGFELDFRIFSLTAVDSETVQKALADRVPEAKLIFDEKGMRMLVWAAKSEMDKVVIIFETLDPTVLKNLKYMTYPVAIGDPETVLDSIKQVYPNIKSQVDERNKRLLIWATPEEHAAIAEMIEATNKDTQVTLQERFRSYPVPKLSPASVKEMIETLFPGVEVYSGGYSLSAYGGVTESARVTVRATAREHKDIETLLEDMQSTDDPYHAEFAVYPMGDIDPVTLEALLQGMFPDAESLTGYEIKNLLQDDPMRNMRLQYGGIWFGDMPMNRTQRQIESIRGTRSGCFKVDPGTRSVMVFLPEDDQKKIASLIDDITKIAKISGKMTVRRYELEEGYIYRYIPMLQEIVPTAKITGSYGSEIVVFATEEDHKLIQKCIDEIDALGKPGSQRVYQVITIPDGSGIPRDLLVQQIWSNFSGYAQNGPLPNQIVYNGYQKEIPKIEKLIEDMAAEQLEKSNALPKVYTLKYISVTNAKKWLQATVPNAQFEAPTQIFRPFYNPYYNDPYQSTLQTSDDPTARTLVIRATPLDHKLIAEALEVLDVDLPEEIRPVPRDYEFVLYPPSMMTWSWYALREAFPPPQATFVMNSERIAILAVASPKTHEEIKKFIDNFVQQKMEELPVLEVYAMKNFPALRAMQLIRQMQTYSSRITMFQGATPEQIIVYARPVDQAKVVEFIAKLESITVPENMMMLKAYQVPPDALIFTQNALRSQIVGGIVYTLDSTATSAIAPLWMPGGPTQYRANLANSTIIVYGTEADHALAEKLTESMGESFPEPVTKTYFTKNIPIGEAFIFLNRQFAGRAAAIYVRQDTGDMIVSATPPLHEEIQKTIDAIDVPRPPESEKIVVVHDLGELRPGAISWFFSSMQYVSPGAIVLPSATTGQFLVYATPVEQVKIQKVVDEMLVKNAETQSVAEVYALKNFSVTRAMALIPPMIDPSGVRIQILQGTTPDQIVVYAKPSDQLQVAELLDKLETITVPEDTMQLKAYPVQPSIVSTVVYSLQLQIVSGGFAIPNVQDSTVIVYGSESDHAIAAQLTKSLGELIPEHITKTFFTKYIPIGEAYGSLAVHFAGRASIYVRADTGDLIAHATPAMLEEIQKHIDAIDVPRPPESEKMVVVHDISDMPIYYQFWAMNYLRNISPDILILPTSTNAQFLVYATPVEQAKIQKIIDEMLAKNPETDRVPENYTLNSMTAINAWQNFLVHVAPNGQPGFDVNDPYKMTIMAKPSAHVRIQELVDKLNEEAAVAHFQTENYEFKYVVANTAWAYFLAPLVPGIQPGLNPLNPHRISIQATAEQHKKIADIVAKLNEDATIAQLQTENYEFKFMAATASWTNFLSQVAPGALPGFDSLNPYRISILATSAQHEKLAEVVAKLNEEDETTQPVPENYSLNGMMAYPAWNNFLVQVAPNARVGFNTADPYKLTVWDTPLSHERIKTAVDKLNEDSGRANEVRMYRFQRVTWQTAYQLLSSRFPGMTMSYDPLSNSVVAHGTPAEHKIIEKLVAEMDKYDSNTQTSIKIHNTGSVDAYELINAFRRFYGYGSNGQYFDFNITTDTSGRNLIVTASPHQHEQIASLIKQMNEGGLKDPNIKLEIYDMEKLNWMLVRYAIVQFFLSEGISITPVFDMMSERMMILARPQDHAAIRKIMDSFRTEERELVIFALQELDPQSVRTMVTQIFSEEPFTKQPTITEDYYSDMLYIRATKSQHEKIRNLLAVFGETGVAEPTARPIGYQPGGSGRGNPAAPPSPGVTGTGVIRTIPAGGNPEETIEQLQKLWQQVNPDHPLVVPSMNDEEKPPQQPAATPPTTQPATTSPAQPSTGFRAPQGMTGTDGPRMMEWDEQQLSRVTVLPQFDAIAYVSYAEPVSELQEVPALNLSQPAEPQQPQPEPQPVAPQQPEATPTPEAPADTYPSSQTPSAYVIVNADGTLSLVSNDTAALDRLTAAFARSQQPEAQDEATPKFNRVLYEDRNYTEFAVRYLSPQILVTRLQMRMSSRFPNRQSAATQSGYMQRGVRGGMGGYDPAGGYATSGLRPTLPSLFPQEATNSIIVTGSKRDRIIVGELIDQLDIPDPIYKPVLVPVLNSDANKVHMQLLTTYGRYLRAIRLPNGVPAGTGVDTLTNSIWIQGPNDLVETLTKYIEETDKTLLDNPPRKITVYPLDKINSTVLTSVLEEFRKQSFLNQMNQNQMYNPFGMMMYQQPYAGYGVTGGYGGYGGYGGMSTMPGSYQRSPY